MDRAVLRGDGLPFDWSDMVDGVSPLSKSKRLRGELRKVIVVVDLVGVRRIEYMAAADVGILSGDHVIERRRPR